MRIFTAQHRLGIGWEGLPGPAIDSSKTVIFIFGAPEYNKEHTLLKELRDRYPVSKMVGCSGSGEIFGSTVNDRSLSVAFAVFDDPATRIKTVVIPIGNVSESEAVGRNLGDQLHAEDLRAIMLFSDGLNVNGSDLVKGINEIVPGHISVTGGLAGDGARFQHTWVLNEGTPESQIVSAIGFYGPKIRVHHGSKGGWDLFGPERKITRSENNILYELDGKPALALYKEYLGEKARDLPSSGLLFPLQIRSRHTREGKLVRTILSVDETTQSLVFAGNVPEGSLAQLMRANFDRLIEGASEAASDLQSTSQQKLLIAISCVGRRLVLGERTEEETEATLSAMPEGTVQIGFYSYGEISPFVQGTSCELHNQTMTLTSISEDG